MIIKENPPGINPFLDGGLKPACRAGRQVPHVKKPFLFSAIGYTVGIMNEEKTEQLILVCQKGDVEAVARIDRAASALEAAASAKTA